MPDEQEPVGGFVVDDIGPVSRVLGQHVLVEVGGVGVGEDVLVAVEEGEGSHPGRTGSLMIGERVRSLIGSNAI